jgi:hypothetical protein
MMRCKKHNTRLWFRFHNDLWAIGFGKAWSHDDWKGSWAAKFNYNPSDRLYKVNLSSNINAPEISGIKTHLHVSYLKFKLFRLTLNTGKSIKKTKVFRLPLILTKIMIVLDSE